MKYLFSDSNLSTPINALNVRKLLGDLTPVSERKKGGYGRSVLYGLSVGILAMCLLFFILMLMVDANVDKNIALIFITIGVFTCLYLMLFITAREQSIASQNEVEELRKMLTPHLNEGEKFLLLQLGCKNSTHIPTWSSKEGMCSFSHFIFTTDRLLVVTFQRHVHGAYLINNYLETGQYDSNANGLYSVDLLDPKAFEIGGFITPPFMNIGYTKCTVCPIGESESYTWNLTSGFTQNGKLLKNIRHRLKHGYSQAL